MLIGDSITSSRSGNSKQHKEGQRPDPESHGDKGETLEREVKGGLDEGIK